VTNDDWVDPDDVPELGPEWFEKAERGPIKDYLARRNLTDEQRKYAEAAIKVMAEHHETLVRLKDR
jgi:hypothetical protein